MVISINESLISESQDISEEKPVVQETIYDDLALQEPKLIDNEINLPDLSDKEIPSSYDDIINNLQERENNIFNSTISDAVKKNPDKIGEMQRFASEAGMPFDIAQRNFSKIKEMAYTNSVKNKMLSKYSPILNKQLRDPDFASIAYDDIDNLSTTESIINWFKEIPEDIGIGWEKGQLQTQLGFLGHRAQSGMAISEDYNQIGILEEKIKELEGSGGALESASTILGQISTTLPTALESGIYTGFTTGSAALIAGQLGPQVTIPEEIITVPAATIGGLFAGMLAKMGEQSYKLEAGHSYLDMIREGIDKNVAVNVSAGVGLVNAALEITGAGFVAAPIKRLLIRNVTKKYTDALTKPALKTAVKNFATQYGKAWAGEVTTEILQEFTSIIGEEFARSINPEAMTTRLSTEKGREEISDRIIDTFEQVAKGMSILALPAPAFNFYYDAQRVISSRKETQFIDNLSNSVSQSKVKTRNPSQYENFIYSQTKGTSVENFYIDSKKLKSLMLQQNIQKNDLDKIIPGIEDQLNKSDIISGDIEIPVNQYASKIAGTDLDNVLKYNLKINPESFTYNEIQEFEQNRNNLFQQAKNEFEKQHSKSENFNESSRKVRKNILNQVLKTKKISAKQSGIYADFINSFISNQALSLNETPEQFYNEYNLTIENAKISQPGKKIKGAFDASNFKILIDESADFSTFVHESSHFFLTVFSYLAKKPNASQETISDFDKILNWFGVSSINEWDSLQASDYRKFQEQWAYNFELYLFEGKSPSQKLKNIFNKFSSWLSNVYRSIRDDVNVIYKEENKVDLPILTGEVRSVMDRMLASSDQIDQAEKIRNMAPLFENIEQSGLSKENWNEYSRLSTEIKDSAISDLNIASLKQMRWASRAESKILKEIQQKAKIKKDAIRNRISSEINELPIYKAINFLRYGQTVDENNQPVLVKSGNKISIDSIKDFYKNRKIPDLKKLGFGKTGMLSKEGLPVEVFSDMFGFNSVDAFLKLLFSTPSLENEINLRAEKQLLIENDELIDPKKIEQKIEEALHTELRSRFIAIEFNALSKSQTPKRILISAAKEVALNILNSTEIKNIKSYKYSLAEKKAARETFNFMKKGMIAEAIDAKNNQLLQNQLTIEASKIEKQVTSDLKKFKKFFVSNEKLSKTYNMDFINSGREILSLYGIGGKTKKPKESLELIRAYNPEFYAEIEPLIRNAQENSIDYRFLSFNEFTSLSEILETLFFQARRSLQIVIENKNYSLNNIIDELSNRLHEIGIPEEVAGETLAPSGKQRFLRTINFTRAMMRRVEHWADAMDGPSKETGPFTKYLWRPLRNALTEYRNQRNIYVKRYSEIVDKLKLSRGKIDAVELNYIFGNDNGGIGKAELLGALLHTGNKSNFRKLILGRGWGELNEDGSINSSRWESFLQRMIDTGQLIKSDFDFLQETWDLLEEIKPQAQKAHKEIFGYYFKEVKASSFTTKFGTYRGGYVPAKADPFLVRDVQQHAKMEELESDFRQSLPTTGAGFTKSRVEYNRPLSFDIRIMAKHIDDVLRFSNIQPIIKDILKIIRNRGFANILTRLDPNAIEDMLIPWLNRTARQQTVEPGRHKGVDNFWRILRNRTGISIMFANLTNALQQFTGYFPSALRIKSRYLKQGLFAYMAHPSRVSNEISELSPFMRERLDSQLFDLQEKINDLLINPNSFNKMQRWVQHHGYFLQRAFQNQIDIVTWLGSYNQALADQESNISDKKAIQEAVQRANADVRLTQSSLYAEDISAVEVGTPFYKTLVQFSNYFNMIANLNANEYIKVMRDLGVKGNVGRLFMIYLLGFAAPLLIADAIVKIFGGEWDDEEEDGYLNEFADWFFLGQLRGLVALVPFGTTAIVPLNALNDKPYDDRMTTSPAVSSLEAATVGSVRTAINLIDPEKELTGKNIKDSLTLLSLITGIPFSAAGKPIGYAYDVERGKIEPESEYDYFRSLLTGKAGK